MKRTLTLTRRWVALMSMLAILWGMSAPSGAQTCTVTPSVNGVPVPGSSPGSIDFQLGPGECCLEATVLFSLDSMGCVPIFGCAPQLITVNLPDGSGFAITHVNTFTECLPPGTTSVVFEWSNCDTTGLETFELNINVHEYVPATTGLACNDRVNVSLSDSCEATILPDMVLEGNEYACWDRYEVIIHGPGNTTIDRNPALPGPQVDMTDLGNCYKTSVVDTVTGNSCWGIICIEDKLPPQIICHDTVVPCQDPTTVDTVAPPTVIENCGYTLSYTDEIITGGCADQYSYKINRTWIATDKAGNTASCTQMIFVALGDLAGIAPPPNYDGLPGNKPPLKCDERRDGRPGNGIDTLGWNYIESGPYAGHPSPDDVLYPNGNVQWHGTGYPSGTGCSNFAVTFEDRRFDIAADNCDAGEVGCFKVLRRWTVLDWCTGEVRTFDQLIKVVDDEPPVTHLPDTVMVGTDPWRCSGTFIVPDPAATDNCSNDVHYTVESTSGVVLGDAVRGFTVTNLPLGKHLVIVTTSDCCGNSAKDTIVVMVVDDDPPQAVCDQHTVVSLGTNGQIGDNVTKVYATTFDDGSFDNCSDSVWFKVIRMEELLGTLHGSTSHNTVACQGLNGDDDPHIGGNQVYFDDFTKFCCSDAGDTIMVVLRVFDVNPGDGPVHPSRMYNGDLKGRFTDCMVEVVVQDKSIPLVVPPPDIVVSCMFWFDDSEAALTDLNNRTFGTIVKSLDDRQPVVTHDKVCEAYCTPNARTGYPVVPKACDFFDNLYNPANPSQRYDLQWGYDGYAIGSCDVECEITVRDARECGQGPIYRYFTVYSNGRAQTAVQTIWVVDCDPFYISDVCTDPNDDIIWPNHCQDPELLNGCGANTSPDNPLLGRPELVPGADDNCAMISITYEDKRYTIQEDACYKILRDWVVIDWCQFDPTINLDRDGDGVIDYHHPHPGEWHFLQIIKVRDTEAPQVDIKLGPCEPADSSARWGCVGHLSITVDADDECTIDAELIYEYKIDLFNDGTYDLRVGPAKPGNLPLYRNNPYADDNTDVVNASGTYPLGTHRITWFVEDGCGNLTIKDTIFEIKDCKAPTPYCRSGVVTVIMPSNGSITVWAKDLDAGSYDNCTAPEDLKFYFYGDTSWTGYQVTCDTFAKYGVQKRYMVEVEMWVEDEEGNTSFCRTIIEVQDNDNVCDSVGSLLYVGGKVATEEGVQMQGAPVELWKDGSYLISTNTDQRGAYGFAQLEPGRDYIVKPYRNDKFLQGVSTRDLVAIHKHLLGIRPLNSPYKMVAADVNNNEDVSVADVSIIRSLILGKIRKYPASTSWKFIPTSFQFEDVRDPWRRKFPEELRYERLEQSILDADFVVIKMGDVTGDAVQLDQGNAPRSVATYQLLYTPLSGKAGERKVVYVTAAQDMTIEGLQLSLGYDRDAAKLIEVRSPLASWSDEHYAIFDEQGTLNISWNQIGNARLAAQSTVFQLVFELQRDLDQAAVVYLQPNRMPTEVFDEEGQLYNIELKIAATATSDFALYQNVPNPWNTTTTIRFVLPEDMKYQLSFMTPEGKVVKKLMQRGNAGLNEVILDVEAIDHEGVLYYQLSAGKYTATRKMILMRK